MSILLGSRCDAVCVRGRAADAVCGCAADAVCGRAAGAVCGRAAGALCGRAADAACGRARQDRLNRDADQLGENLISFPANMFGKLT